MRDVDVGIPMENKKYHCRNRSTTQQKNNRKMHNGYPQQIYMTVHFPGWCRHVAITYQNRTKRQQSIPLKYITLTFLAWYRLFYESGGAKLALQTQTAIISEVMRSCKYLTYVSEISTHRLAPDEQRHYKKKAALIEHHNYSTVLY